MSVELTKNVLILGMNTPIWGLIRKFNGSELLNNIFLISTFNPQLLNCTYLGSPKTLKISDLKRILKEYKIDFVIILSTFYYLSGIYDFIKNKLDIPVFGISYNAVKLETSKLTGKEFIQKYNILTPEYLTVSSKNQLKNAVDKFGFPVVIKNDNLQAGFGSHICINEKEAFKTVKKLLKKFDFCIAEKFIQGTEITRHYIWDKNSLIPLKAVKDFKKSKDGNKGINTGGLASYTPVKLTEKQKQLLEQYDINLKNAFLDSGFDFTGVFCVDLLFSKDDVYTLEFNMRPGITEFETLIENINSDVFELFYKTALGSAKEVSISYKEMITGCVAVTHKNYCRQKHKIKEVCLKKFILPVLENNIKINFNIWGFKKNKLLINCARPVFNIINSDKNNPFAGIYEYINTIETGNLFYRKDIGEYL